MGLVIARFLPPVAVALAIVSLDYARHAWWHSLEAWSVFLMVVPVAAVAAYILGEFLMRFFTRRYSTSVKIAAEIAGLPSALELIGEHSQPQRGLMAKQELLRQMANLAKVDGAAFFAAQAGWDRANLDTTYGIPDGSLPQDLNINGNGHMDGETPESHEDKVTAALQPALGKAGFSNLDVLSLRSGGQAVGYLVLAGHRKPQEWLDWQEARDLVESQAGGILRNLLLASEGQMLAALRERERIARELHDSLAQTLTYIHAEASAALTTPHSPIDAATRVQIESIDAAAREGYGDIRTSILDLRRSGKIAGQDFLGLLEEYLQRFARDTGLSAEIVVEPGAVTCFPAPVEIQLLRVVQEALTNVRKHAIGAKHVEVVFCKKPGAACVCIQDDGVGFSVAPILQGSKGFGLISMRERLREIGGTLIIESGPGIGTKILARVPL